MRQIIILTYCTTVKDYGRLKARKNHFGLYQVEQAKLVKLVNV